jgi:DNA transposition AAA+ family ATPase
MTEETTLYNTVAPLANVARLGALIDRTVNRAHGLPGMGCYYGQAGYGKTTAGIYCTNTLDAVHVEAVPLGGIKKLLGMIVIELGLKPKRLVTDLFDQAAQELAVTNRPLIIDEADQILTDRMIETIRHLHDKSGAPVILMGEEMLPQKLTRWERVHGRMLAWVRAEPATIDDVRHLARIYAPRVEITAELQEAVLTASRASMRYISTNLAAIAEHAAVRGLQRVTLADWGKTAFHTGEPPVLRRNMDAPALARRGRAA